MEAETFLDNFGAIAEAPGGVEQLRRFILDQAVAGRLLTTAADDSAVIAELMRAKKAALLEAGAINAPRRFKGRPLTEHLYPSNWTSVHLGDVCLVVMGNSPPGDSYNDAGAGVPLINGPVEFSVGPFGETQRTKFTTEPGRMCEPGDLLVCVRGATTGRTNIASFEACIGRGVALVRGWESQGFINLFMWRIGKHLLATGKGTTFPSISYDDLAGLAFGLPPLVEQQLIVERVHELMQLCDDLEAQQQARNDVATRLRASSLDALTTADNEDDFQKAWSRVHENWAALFADHLSIEELRQTILQLAVRGRISVPSLSDESVAEVLARVDHRKASLVAEGALRKRTELIRPETSEFPVPLPSGWSLERLDRITAIMGGIAKGRKLGARETRSMPYLRVANVKAGKLALEEIKEIQIPIDEIAKYKLEHGDVLLTEGGDWDKLGRSAIWRSEVDICAHQNHVFRARPLDPSILPEWVSMFTNSPDGRRYFQSKAKRTTNLASINMTELRATAIPLPPASVQREIIQRVNQLLALCDELEASIERKDRSSNEIRLSAASSSGSTSR